MEDIGYTAVVFGCLAVGSMVVIMATTFAKCGKTDFLTSLKNGAITAACLLYTSPSPRD